MSVLGGGRGAGAGSAGGRVRGMTAARPAPVAGAGPGAVPGVRGGGRAPGVLPRARGRGRACAVGAPRRSTHPPFDDTVAWLATRTSKSTLEQLLRIAWRTVGAIVSRVVAEGAAQRDPLAG